jgi:hypothetical protein
MPSRGTENHEGNFVTYGKPILIYTSMVMVTEGGGEAIRSPTKKDCKSENSFLLGCYAVPLTNYFSAFQTIVLIPASC